LFFQAVVQTLRAHASRINGLCYVRSAALGHVILSYGCDGTFVVHTSENPLHSWTLLHSKQVQTGVPIVSAHVCSLPASDNNLLVAFSCADASVHVYKVGPDACEAVQNWKMHTTQIASEVHLCVLEDTTGSTSSGDDAMLCLFLGCTDAKIHMYTTTVGRAAAAGSGDVMRAAGVLVGHQDWGACILFGDRS
jgi:hypothetical protein